MQITNRYNLPPPLVEAIRNDSYSMGDADISVTTLIGPPRIRVLKKRHDGELSEDASDLIWSLMGRIGHGILERAADGGMQIVEKMMFIERHGWKIKGQADLFHERGVDRVLVGDPWDDSKQELTIEARPNALLDYKFCSRYVANEGIKPEWEQQTNIYRLMAKETEGIDIKHLNIVAIFRDWSKRQADRERDYPQAQVISFDVPIWDYQQTEDFITERIALHKAAEVELPYCTPEERWAKPDNWAVMKKGNKRAVRGGLHDNPRAAYGHAKRDDSLYVEYRPSENVRCESYCAVSGFCDQWKAIQDERRKANARAEGDAGTPS